MEQEALKYLQKDRLLHIDMLEPLRLKEARVLYAWEDGVLMHNVPVGIYMLSAATEESAGKIAGLMKDASVILLHQPFLKEEIKTRFSLALTMPCYQAAWLKDERVLEPPDDTDIRPLTMADLETVQKHYTNVTDDSYVRERLEAGMLGAYVDGKLAGFIGTHPEGSIGLLEVLPEYRRRGLAMRLEVAMMVRQQAFGRIPYAQIKLRNDASIALHKKLGMEITAEASLCWLY